jgi:hypothetical protein
MPNMPEFRELAIPTYESARALREALATGQAWVGSGTGWRARYEVAEVHHPDGRSQPVLVRHEVNTAGVGLKVVCLERPRIQGEWWEVNDLRLKDAVLSSSHSTPRDAVSVALPRDLLGFLEDVSTGTIQANWPETSYGYPSVAVRTVVEAMRRTHLLPGAQLG